MRKLLFFYADWCPPCKFYEKQFISPIAESAGAEHVEKIDAWNNPLIAKKYYVGRLPTVVLMDNENVYMYRTGAIDIKRTSQWLKGKWSIDLPPAGNAEEKRSDAV